MSRGAGRQKRVLGAATAAHRATARCTPTSKTVRGTPGPPGAEKVTRRLFQNISVDTSGAEQGARAVDTPVDTS